MGENFEEPEGLPDALETAFGMLAMQVRELTAYVMVVCTVLEQASRGVLADDELRAEYTQTRDQLLELHRRVTGLARVFGPESEFPPPPGDE